MTLTIHEVEQGTDSWHDVRRGIVTASVVGKLLTPTLKVADNDVSRALTATLVAERLTGVTEPSYTNADMERGVLSEPIARDHYSGHYQQAEEAGFYVREEDGWTLGFSPDGVVGFDGLLEVKSPRAKAHLLTILADKVPAAYMPQLQAGLLVTGRDYIDFCSYHGGLPLYVKRVNPDPAWFAAIENACRRFETTAVEMVAEYRHAAQDMPSTERVNFDLGLVF